jgi:hypothetical protein
MVFYAMPKVWSHLAMSVVDFAFLHITISYQMNCRVFELTVGSDKTSYAGNWARRMNVTAQDPLS